MSEDVNRAWKDQYMLRFPEGMRDQIKLSAEVTGRSMNAEIIQRLKWTFQDSEDHALRIVLPVETLNALMTDAAMSGMSDEELVVEIVKANYGQAELARSFDAVNKMADENTKLSELVSHMKEKEDADFLLYYSKVVQLRQLAQAIIAAEADVPDHIATTAHDLDALGKAEMETLAHRHADALFVKKLAEHSRRLREDIEENSGDSGAGNADQDDGDAQHWDWKNSQTDAPQPVEKPTKTPRKRQKR